jgi:sulfite reductase (NADPH) flavoprotein alpha-component
LSSITILFGTETGNSESASKRLASTLHQAGYNAIVTELSALPPIELPKTRLLLVIVSTFGSGDPPMNAEKMLQHLQKTPALRGVRYGVCALGDSTYQNFAQCGRDYDRWLAECGAERVIELCVCDVDYEQNFPTFQANVFSWLKENGAEFTGYEPPKKKRALGWLKGLLGGRKAEDDAGQLPRVAPASGPKPTLARVLARRRLNGNGSAKETWHYELELEDSDFNYEPGDSIAVHPTNSSADVARFLAQTGLDGAARVLVGETETTFARLLETRDLQRMTSGFQLFLARGRGPLATPGVDADAYRRERHLLEALSEHQDFGPLELDAVLEELLPIAPRLYSTASTPRTNRNVVHLTVETPRYEHDGYRRVGLASGYLCDRVRDGERILVHKVKGTHFRSAPPSADAIWIGPGTGVAPYRAFLAERRLDGGTGRSWLFFGHQHQETDFLYRDEWLAQLEAGSLTRLDCAWSRDQPEKRYVQHLIEEQGAEVWAWIQAGAIVYVCGDKSRMAADVHRTLVRLAETQAGFDRARADEYWKDLEKQGRYRVDVY